MPHSITGTVISASGMSLMLRLRDGSAVAVDTEAAQRGHDMAMPVAGQAARARGDWNGKVFAAKVVLHAKSNAALWAKDS